MRDLAQLPHRFWPANQLPEGVEARSKFINMKAAKFKKAYTKIVSPVIRKSGFRCKGTKGALTGEEMWIGTWFLAGKYGGKGMVFIAAHPLGFPARNEYDVEPPYDYPQCIFMKALRFAEGRDGTQFDLGKNDEEAAFTAELMAEAFAEQGAPYVEHLHTAMDQLRQMTPDQFSSEAPRVHAALSLKLTDFASESPESSIPEFALLLARVHTLAKSAHVRGFCELGLEALQKEQRGGTAAIVLETMLRRLPEGPLAPTQEEKQAAWNR